MSLNHINQIIFHSKDFKTDDEENLLKGSCKATQIEHHKTVQIDIKKLKS